MKIIKNKVNILLFCAVLIFTITCVLHIFNEKKMAQAQAGSAGGRILTITVTPLAPGCIGIPCKCSLPGDLNYTTVILPYGGSCALFCFPQVNVPNTGVPITPASVGYQILGFFTPCVPLTQSTNWGTSL